VKVSRVQRQRPFRLKIVRSPSGELLETPLVRVYTEMNSPNDG
jgi:hypothetical protein